MKKASLLIPVIAVAIMSCNSGETKTETKDSTSTTTVATTAPAKVEAPAPKMDSAAKMKACVDYMTPGEMHKWMASMAGTWTTEATMWEEEGKPPMTSTGASEVKMIMGGRYQQAVHKSNMMGMPFEGLSTMAYDNVKKVFVNTWIDNMGTGIWCIQGPYDAASKTLTLTGKCVDPTTGKDMDIREVTKFPDDKHQVMEMYVTQAGGKEFKNMELKFTKK